MLWKTRRVFYCATVFFLLCSVASAFLQQWCVATSIKAKVANVDAQPCLQSATYWWIVSILTVAFAILSCAFAIWHREDPRWMRVFIVVLLVFYVLLELMII